MNIRTIACIFLTLIALSTFRVSFVNAVQQMDEKVKPPDPALKSPIGEIHPLSANIGKKPVLLVFWASWCTICNDEIPLLKKLNADRFKVIAVNEGESAWKIKRFVATNNIDYQIALDSDGSVAKAFQVPGVPACVVLDKSGRIVYRGIGLPEHPDSYAGK
jgi:thiol-disulfide isomerase/thioredoxin